ncbi:hypothetical protein HYFRA_00000311 [Hymenoscyphus fraxineus]|uniref:DUF427 domain-containing protein n=1 Tax=Hymenoscyphus fraxineus TaxID=746836 RepID=A0A9N9PWN1_9HELO|nr:hypothetical protein HYFRA_00000311 [Hymenoscyphus fraxineus]
MTEAYLKALGEKLTKEGPHKVEDTPRRVRGVLGGEYIFDTTEAKYIWEHPYYPYFYVPTTSLKLQEFNKETDPKLPYFIANIKNHGKTALVLGFTHGGPLDGMSRISVPSLDKWLVEDEILQGPHPKDPYKRVETIPSSREIRIEHKGKTILTSSQNIFLYETMLRPRYYLSPGAVVDWGSLVESETTTFCPYKGMANYYHLKVGDETVEDAIWYYKYPTSESALIAGRLCFYNEKFDVFVDGVKEKK